MKRVRLFMIVAMAALILVSCGSSKEAVQLTTIPCQECKATAETFRYLGQEVSDSDYQSQYARSMAANVARTELAAMVSATIERVTDNYAGQIVNNENSDFSRNVKDLARTVVNQLVKGTPVTCEAKEAGSKKGSTIYYACVELTGKSVLDELANQISNDEKLRVEFEYEKFKKVFEEEMSKIQQ